MKRNLTLSVLAIAAAFALGACGSASAPAADSGTKAAESAAPEESKKEDAETAAAEDSKKEDAEAAAAEDGKKEESGDAAEEKKGEPAAEFAEIADGILTVGFDAEYPPYGYMDDNGEYTGFDLELAEVLCENNGWTLEKKPINWDSKDMELNSGSIDCIWNGFTMNGREDDYAFSIPYVDNSQVIVCSSDSGIEKLSDLAGKIVGVQAASAALDLLEGDQKDLADTFSSLNQFADYNTAFTELQAGALDALAIDVGVAKYQINSRGEDFVILAESLNTEQYAVGFKKGSDDFAQLVSKGLCQMALDGKVSELAEKYEIADMVTLTPEFAEELLSESDEGE